MALFKICRGNESNLPDTLTDGYAYFCTDTGNFYIDWADAEANVSRKHINAEYATKLRFKDENDEWVEIDPKDLHEMLGFEQVQADWEQNDPTASSYILNRPFGLMPDLYSGTKTSTPVDGKTSLYQLSGGIGINELEDEKSYDVIWDGISYPCVCRHVTLHSSTGTDVGATVLGNANLLRERFAVGITVEVTQDAYPSDAPFCFSMLYNLSSEGGTHTVVLRDGGDAALKKLDVKYLPDFVATQDFVIEQIENIDIDQVQVDWNENDPSAKGYILNRPFGALPNLFEATLNITEDNMIVDGVYKADNTVNITRDCVVGDTYNVFWRGAKYVCEFQQHTAHGPTGGSVGIDHLGNISLFAAQYPDWTIDGESNGLPFFIWGSTVLVNYPDHSTLVVSLDDATNFTKLDAKYLPDEAATKDFVMQQMAGLDTNQVNADWNEVDSTKASYILNRPFGLIQDIVSQESYEFSHANNGSTAYRCGTASQTSAVIANPIHEQLQVGETYIVIWDNVPYECVLAKVPVTGPNNLVGTSPILGNPTLLNRYDSQWNYEGEDNNCPFLLSLMFDIAETKGAHTVAIRAKNNFTKLDVKYLPDEAATKEYVQEALADVDIEQVQADWGETDSSQPSYIKRKPLLSQAGRYGSFNYLTERIVGDVVVPLPETTYQFVLRQNNDGSNDYYYAAGNASSDLQQILCGQTYRVVWDENEFICVGQPMSSVGHGGLDLPGFCFLGNISIWDGMGVDEDTGEPFVVLYNPFENTRPLIGDSTIQTYSDAAEHTISITPVNDVIKLDKKYLPDDLATEKFVEDKIANIKVSGGGTVEQQVDLIPEQEIGIFYPNEEYAGYYYYEHSHTSFKSQLVGLSVGDTCTVVWDEQDYPCVVGDSSAVVPGTLFLGNGSFANLSGNGEPFGIAWNENGITLLAADRSTDEYHTIRVYQTKVSSAGGVSSWNDLTDKPFYDEEVVVFEGEFQGTKYDSDGDGVMDAWEDMMFAPYNNEDPLVVGQTYTFYWDGVKYTSECYSLMGVGAIGFNAITSEGMSAYPVAMGLDIGGMMTGGTPAWIAMHAIAPTDMSHSGLHSCKIITQETKKIDDKYQHQPDWDETDVNRASFVKNKPFGVLSKAGVLYESDVSYEAYDFGFMLMDFASDDVIIGGNYKVSVNGVSYTGVCEGAGSLEDGAITYTHLVRLNADGYSTLGLVCNPTLVEVGVTIPATLAPENLLGDTRWENGEVCHIVISAMDEIVATVPHKYLDFIEKHEDIVIPKMDVEMWLDGGLLGTHIPATPEALQKVRSHDGGSIYVQYDGVEYKTKIYAGNCFGDVSVLGAEVESTGEPYVIAYDVIDAQDVWVLADVSGTYSDATSTITKSIKVWFDGQATVKNEFLPMMAKSDSTETIARHTLTVTESFSVDVLGYTMYKLSDKTPTKDQLFASDVRADGNNGVSVTFSPSESDVIFQSADTLGVNTYNNEGTGTAIGLCVCYKAGDGSVVIDGATIPVTVPSIGTYCIYPTSYPIPDMLIQINYPAEEKWTIKEEYLPEIHAEPAEIPYFDLTAMGLPEIPLDGTWVTASYDMTELRDAAAKGVIKTTSRIAGLTMDTVSSLIYIREADIYSYTNVGTFGSTPVVIMINVGVNEIKAGCAPLTGGAPVTMTDVSQEGA